MKKAIAVFITSALLVTTEAYAKQTATEYARLHQQIIATSRVTSVVKSEIDKILDYDVMIKESLGPSYELVTAEQASQINSLLRIVIRTNLACKMFGAGPRITWLSEEAITPNTYIVKSVIAPRAGSSEEPLNVDYVIRWDQTGYHVVDVLFEDVSTIRSYRSQFSRIIHREGIPTLINKLKEKVKTLSIEESDGC